MTEPAVDDNKSEEGPPTAKQSCIPYIDALWFCYSKPATTCDWPCISLLTNAVLIALVPYSPSPSADKVLSVRERGRLPGALARLDRLLQKPHQVCTGDGSAAAAHAPLCHSWQLLTLLGCRKRLYSQSLQIHTGSSGPKRKRPPSGTRNLDT